MRKVFDRTEKIELNSFVKDFVDLREKFFTPEQESLEAETREEELWVKADKKQLEMELDSLIKNSLIYGKAFPLKMKISVEKTSEGAWISYSDNGAGTWRSKQISVGKKCRQERKTKENWKMQIA